MTFLKHWMNGMQNFLSKYNAENEARGTMTMRLKNGRGYSRSLSKRLLALFFINFKGGYSERKSKDFHGFR